MKTLMQIWGERIPKPHELHYEGEISHGLYTEGYPIPENCIEGEHGNRTDLLGRSILLCGNYSHQMTEGLPCPNCGWEW